MENNQNVSLLVLEQIDKRNEALRKADQEAVKVLAADTKERFAGFPGEYARKSELEQIRETALRLDKTALPRESYEEAHRRLEEDLAEMLTLVEFRGTLNEWRIWRDNVDRNMAIALGRQEGEAASWRQLVAVLGGVATFLGIVLTLVILFASNTL